MSLFGQLSEWASWFRAYLLGRGLLSLAVITAGVVSSITGVGPLLLPALAVAVGGTILNAFMRIREQRVFESDMISLYRNEIAATRGIAPKDVSRADLYAVAKENEVIGQALTRQRREGAIDFITGALAGAATFGLLYVGLVHTGIPAMLVETFGKFIGGALSIFSMGMVAGISSLLINDGLGLLIGAREGLTKATAHDRIVAMERRVQRGRPITREQVFGVLVATNPALDKRIKQKFGESYGHMNLRERNRLIMQIGVAEGMETLATAINAGQVKPSNLAFMLDRAQLVPAAEETASSPSSEPMRGSFVERLGPRPAQGSFVEKLNAGRDTATTERSV